MTLKTWIEQAAKRGENIRDEITGELLNSKWVQELVSHEMFAKAVTTLMQTKEEVTQAIRHHAKHALEVMNVPSRADLTSLERKIDNLDKMLDRMAKKAITVKSLKTLRKKKKTKKK